MAKCKECIHYFVCETLKGKIKDTWAETCVAYRHKKSCVEVVRCKDCKHLMFSDCYGECKRGYMGIVKPWDFCSYGERKGKE